MKKRLEIYENKDYIIVRLTKEYSDRREIYLAVAERNSNEDPIIFAYQYKLDNTFGKRFLLSKISEISINSYSEVEPKTLEEKWLALKLLRVTSNLNFKTIYDTKL